MSDRLLDIYHTLLAAFGPQHWWPGDTPLEVLVGAVLAQNTAWSNVSRAIANLKEANLLSLEALAALPVEELAGHIRPSGYFNQKALRLKNLVHHIDSLHQGDLEQFFDLKTGALREELLSLKGIGPETADSIVLYAAGKPLFVVDTYTHRILSRHNLIGEEAYYHEIQELFMHSLPEEVELYNEYHALLVRLGKEYCKKSKPRCDDCPIRDF
ncbi:MAG: endonuclease III domain-containing protein [Desulfobulbaceae bacterium]|nr:endonuclease III domain-containing protein [Desulfobulbaceae bacterium]